MSHLGFMLLLRLEYADEIDSSPGTIKVSIYFTVLVLFNFYRIAGLTRIWAMIL